MEHGWRMKRLHKMIMTSTTYRQSSRRPADGERAAARTTDPENRLLWRMNLRRLEAEAIRDSVLAASGKLDRETMGGPAIPLKPDSDGLQMISDENPDDKWRRSLYILSRRNYPLSFLEVFDYPLIQTNCNRRINSSTPLQSLTQLNGPFMLEHAQHMAERVSQIAPGREPIRKIESAYLLALSRKPSETERQISNAHLEKQEKLYLLGNFSPGASFQDGPCQHVPDAAFQQRIAIRRVDRARRLRESVQLCGARLGPVSVHGGLSAGIVKLMTPRRCCPEAPRGFPPSARTGHLLPVSESSVSEESMMVRSDMMKSNSEQVAADEDGRAAGQACSLLLVAAGRGAFETAAVR